MYVSAGGGGEASTSSLSTHLALGISSRRFPLANISYKDPSLTLSNELVSRLLLGVSQCVSTSSIRLHFGCLNIFHCCHGASAV